MIDYDYLEWGANVSPEDKIKTTDYKELDEMNFFETGAENVSVREKQDENNEYNVWFFESSPDKPWGENSTARKSRRAEIEKQIANFVKEIKPGHEVWEWRGGYFLDAFLLEDLKEVKSSEYDSVLLLAPDPKDACPLAVIWEMVPETKRAVLMNLQRRGMKIYAAFSDHFQYPDENFVCLEIYLKM